MKKCPKCGNQTFHANAHVVQGWLVDSEGEFVAVSEECVKVTHSPENDDFWTCTKCNYEAEGGEFEVEELDPEEELDKIQAEQLEYIARSGGVLEIREADDNYNDYNRKTIVKYKEAYGSAFLGNINFYGEKRERVAAGIESVYEEYVGQPIYNFHCSFVISKKDEKLEEMIRTWNGGEGKSDINKIFARIEELEGICFLWY